MITPTLRDKYNIFPIIAAKLKTRISPNIRVYPWGSRVKAQGRKNDFDVVVHINLDKTPHVDATGLMILYEMFQQMTDYGQGFRDNPTSSAFHAWFNKVGEEVAKEMSTFTDEFGNPVKVDIMFVVKEPTDRKLIEFEILKGVSDPLRLSALANTDPLVNLPE